MTLLKTALNGWTDYTQHGKFTALLLVAILYLGYTIHRRNALYAGAGSRDRNKTTMTLWLYSGLTAFACICPLSALFLMKYQTAFYSYVWIWAVVPQTALIAWAAAEFLCGLWKKRTLTNLMATVILLGIAFLSGNPVSEWTKEQTAQIPVMDVTIQQNPETSPWETLASLTEYRLAESGEGSFTLWAPKELMAAARAYSAEIYPVYGRSIWDASLGSYSYDTYATGQEDLYLWMSHLEATGETEYVRMDESTGARTIDFADCLKYAAEKNVDIVLLPGNLPEETLSELQNAAGSKLQPLNGYYLLTMQK